MSAGPPLLLPTDRRVLAADLCRFLACGAEDPSVSLEQLARAAREIADFLGDTDPCDAARPRRSLRVIDGGRV
jgi:hypothetical protein